ncbi:MAG: methyl-accepting chemotaxis protein [Gammaproteobacteria bacterium]|nr:methyl-accepting chemotaxis protein [Gammaproteobacteria bacterium]
MKISKKLGISNSILIVMLFISSANGYIATSSLSHKLDFLIENAWSAADGAMEGVISIQEEIIVLRDLLSRGGNINKLEAITSNAKDAFARMISSGLFNKTQIDGLNEQLAIYTKHRDKIVNDFRRDALTDENYQRYLKTADSLLAFLSELEEIGDSKVEGQVDEINSIETRSSYSITVVILLGIATAVLSWWFSVKTIAQPIQNLSLKLQDISEGSGDLTTRLKVSGKDEVAIASSAFNKFVEKLQAMVTQLRDSVEQIDERSHSFRGITNDLRGNVVQQTSETHQVATAINEMAASVQEVAQNAAGASRAADEADKMIEQGNSVVKAAASAVKSLAQEVERSANVLGHLDEQSQAIESVLDVIKAIAEQTNLLALNAAIEAARAGEQGRGFAVVADEVRTLASRTQESTNEIQTMIGALQEASKQAVHAMEGGRSQAEQAVDETDRAASSLSAIRQGITRIVDRNAQIASAAEQQSSVAEEVNRNIDSINNLASESNSYADKTSNASQELSQLASEMRDVVSQFKI